ncbi:MAG: rhodanese-like domain-containing protein [Arcicella sp.]|jgi:glyoxylase-like metal-dependent hydrolase (beta-lactamase superfamily II)/rhodanese-related sulfurtransferase|nr:rhodanese-like domain-containing protein [Arcicella sp.]
MKIEQIYTGCLAQGAYYIESEGEVAIIDPLREVNSYIEKAKRNNAIIKYIFETHFHADFVSGHLELSQKTNAPIIYGPNANPKFEAIIATDNQEFRLGKTTIKVLHTPGHTMESSCYLLLDENQKQVALFSGDTLFIGDVGRPDLAQNGSLTMADLAGHLYDSLNQKIMPLADDVIVYPAHGAGSACGKNMSKETSDTLGNQKAVNYALKPQTKEQFIEAVTDGLTPPPFYFPKNVQLNKTGVQAVREVLKTGLTAHSPKEFEDLVNAVDALIIDTRKPDAFGKGFIPRSIFIGIDGDFAPWVGTLVRDIQQEILIVADEGREEEVVRRLARVGYDNVLGYLQGGIEAWKASGRETDEIDTVSPEEFAEIYKRNNLIIKDVRKTSEFETGHVKDAENIPLAQISELMTEFDKEEPNYVHCAGGYRSMVAASILKSRGYHNVVNIEGGFGAILKTGII